MSSKESRAECSTHGGCPGANSGYSEYVQELGCLPTLHETVQMKVKHNKTWACHLYPNKPCLGTLKELGRRGLDNKPNKDLVTEDDQWDLYI
jgi:hypothetical protein